MEACTWGIINLTSHTNFPAQKTMYGYFRRFAWHTESNYCNAHEYNTWFLARAEQAFPLFELLMKAHTRPFPGSDYDGVPCIQK